MYHYISIPPEGADKYRIDLSVYPENFHAQMQYLADNGYTPVDLYDLSRAITQKIELPPKPISITLDEGYLDHYENGFPVLKQFGFRATIFLPTDFLDRGDPGYMTWDMVHEMSAAGIRFEPHSKSHVNLNERNRDFLIWEMLGSQETVAAHIGYTPKFFCYPGGRYDETAMQVLEELGFWGAVTTQGGTWHGYTDRFEWTRVRLHNYTTLEDFARLIEPGGTVGGKGER
jgi:peptidoglycan/xylan/chitin deacetylase (PgdA/CDA1 family)